MSTTDDSNHYHTLKNIHFVGQHNIIRYKQGKILNWSTSVNKKGNFWNLWFYVKINEQQMKRVGVVVPSSMFRLSPKGGREFTTDSIDYECSSFESSSIPRSYAWTSTLQKLPINTFSQNPPPQVDLGKTLISRECSLVKNDIVDLRMTEGELIAKAIEDTHHD